MERSRMWSLLLIATLIAIGCGGGKPQDASATSDASAGQPIQVAEAPAGAQPAAGGGSAVIQGTVTLDGQAPKLAAIKMSADPVCQQAHSSPVHVEDVVASAQGQLKNVFVYVKDGVSGTYPAPSTPVALDQSGCVYKPHVFGIQVNQPLEVANSDPTAHNVNAKPTANTPFNTAQPSNKAPKVKKTFAKPEVMVKFKCNIHPWMSAYAGVVAHPFFGVSGDDGSFTISGLPAGTYTVEAWHEKYGTQTQSVTVGDGESQSVNFTFKAQ